MSVLRFKFSKKPKGQRSSDSLSPPQDREAMSFSRSSADNLKSQLSPTPSFSSIKSAGAADDFHNGRSHHASSHRRSRTTSRPTNVLPRFQMEEMRSISSVINISIGTYLEYINQERLSRLPRRGSPWDRVLQAAQFFGLQICLFEDKINALRYGKRNPAFAASAALSACQILLELGHSQAQALLPTFVVLHDLSTILSDIGRIPDLDQLAPGIQNDAARTLTDLVQLVKAIAAEYQQRINGLKSGADAHISVDALFGSKIHQLWQFRESLAERIWTEKLEGAQFPLTSKELGWKLQSPLRQTFYSRLFGHVSDHFDRSEESCDWFMDQLSQFFGGPEQMLCVTGSASSGKTVLAEWIEERLSSPVDGKSYAVLRFDFPYNSPDEAAPVAFLKEILSKLLEQNIGNVRLYEDIMRAFDGHVKEKQVDESLESALWKALHECLQHTHHYDTSLVIMSDNCDWIAGRGGLDSFMAALQGCISDIPHVRVITFARQEPGQLPAPYRRFSITDQEVREDISTHFADVLLQSPHFRQLGRDEFRQLVQDLVEKCKGNWLWVFYAGRLLFNKRSKSSITTASQDLPADISDLLAQVVDLLDLPTNTILRALISMMLVIGRPLAISECIQLFANDSLNSAPPPNIAALISDTCDDIIIVRGGFVHFRTEVVQAYMRAQLGSPLLLSVSEAHTELTWRMLLYARFFLGVEGEASIDELPHDYVSGLFLRNPLLGYVVYHWPHHLKASGILASSSSEEDDQALLMKKELGHAFPTSVRFALLETTCWSRQHTAEEYVLLLELALRVREACFSEHLNHGGSGAATVLQSLINLGRSTPVDGSEIAVITAASYYRKAANLGVLTLGETSPIVERCMILFLELTETLTITTRTDIAAHREEIIKLVLKVMKQKYGTSSDQVIHWHKKLAELYVAIHEENHATIVYHDLHEAMVQRYGEESSEAREIGANFGNLNLVLKGRPAQEIREYEYFILKTSELEVARDSQSIEKLRQLTESYVACGSQSRAERLYARLWQRACVAASSPDAGIEHHVTKIRIALEYSKFLCEQKRGEEAYSILICLWAEYEHADFEAEELLLCLREIALAMRTFGSTSLAVNILNKVWGFFKRSGRGDDVEARKTTSLITEVVDEIADARGLNSTTTTTTTTTVTEAAELRETVVQEIFNFHLDRCERDGVDGDFFSVCMALINLYTHRQNWQQAEAVITKTLEVAWKPILSQNVKIKLCGHANVAESIRVARQLAVCYSEQGRFEMAERVHLQMFYACLDNLPLEDALLLETIAVLVEFYENHHRHAEVIGIYVEVLQRYQTDLGRKHRMTIRTLYALADRCKMLGRQDAYHHYLEIANVLNQGIHYCHPDAVLAALVLCKYYHARGRWSELQQMCVALWETILNHRSEYPSTEDIITFVFEKYMHVLELEAQVDFSALYKLAVEYKDVISVVCGFNSPLVNKTLIALAKVCEKDEQHHQEAVALYEEVLNKGGADHRDIALIKKSLSKMYVKVSTRRRKTSTSTSASGSGSAPAAISLDRAVNISLESYELTKAELPCWHEKTLLKLRDVVTLYHRMDTEDSRSLSFQLLRAAIREIITTTNAKTSPNVNMTLFQSASTIGNIFMSSELLKEGQQLVLQLRQLIVFRGESIGPSQSGATNLDLSLNPYMSKIVFIFLIAFEHGLNGSATTASYSRDMAEIHLEVVLYQEYARTVEKESKLETILQYGSRLRNFWEAHGRVELLNFLDERLFPLFQMEYSQCFVHVDEQDVLLLYCCLLAELGEAQPNSKFDFATFVCMVANAQVHRLLTLGDYHTANRLAYSAFCFSEKQRLYHHASRIHFGYYLAEYMAGIGVVFPSHQPPSQDVQAGMLDTSQKIMTDILAAFETIKLEFKNLRFEDLDDLIRLLGMHHNYAELERLLSHLWEFRDDVRKSVGCDPAAVLEIGIYLVHAQYAMGDWLRAVDTANVMYYNLQRSKGRLDPSTLEIGRLLASLYISNMKPKKALVIHESVLVEISTAFSSGGGGDVKVDSYVLDPPHLAEQATIHMELLRGAHQQCPESTRPEIDRLCARVNEVVSLNLSTFAHSKGISSGDYIAPRVWTIEKLGVTRAERELDTQALVVANARKEHVADWWAVQSPVIDTSSP